MTCQCRCRDLADLADSQCVEQAIERRLLAALELRQQVVRRLFAHSLQAHQLLVIQPEQVRNRAHQVEVDQLLHQFLTEAFDIERLARCEVQDTPNALRAAA